MEKLLNYILPHHQRSPPPPPPQPHAQPTSVDLHTCWTPCVRDFTFALLGNRSAGVWEPPQSRHVLDYRRACVVIVVMDRRWDDAHKKVVFGPADAARHPWWNLISNRVVIDLSDHGVTARERKAYLGCSMLAQSHADVHNHVHDFDVALPLLADGRGELLQRLEATVANTRAENRKYWLTLRSTTYFDSEEGAGRTRLLELNNYDSPDRRVIVRLRCFENHGQHTEPRHQPLCAKLRVSFEAAPAYEDLLNTTFALVPSGRQTGSYRLSEIMAAGAIPVFVSGDASSGSAMVRPLDDVIDWAHISFSFSWYATKSIVPILARQTDATVAAMRRGVQRVWATQLAPGVAPRAFHGLLEARATGRYRR